MKVLLPSAVAPEAPLFVVMDIVGLHPRKHHFSAKALVFGTLFSAVNVEELLVWKDRGTKENAPRFGSLRKRDFVLVHPPFGWLLQRIGNLRAPNGDLMEAKGFGAGLLFDLPKKKLNLVTNRSAANRPKPAASVFGDEKSLWPLLGGAPVKISAPVVAAPRLHADGIVEEDRVPALPVAHLTVEGIAEKP